MVIPFFDNERIGNKKELKAPKLQSFLAENTRFVQHHESKTLHKTPICAGFPSKSSLFSNLFLYTFSLQFLWTSTAFLGANRRRTKFFAYNMNDHELLQNSFHDDSLFLTKQISDQGSADVVPHAEDGSRDSGQRISSKVYGCQATGQS